MSLQCLILRFSGRKSKEEIEKEDREKEIRDKALREEALELASRADLVLFIGGNNRMVETEARDRVNIMLPYGQDDLIRDIAAINPSIITVLVSGAPNDLNVVNQHSKALVMSWFNGTEGGNALADVLLGNISPSGRLPFSLPVKLEDSPAYALGNYPQRSRNRDIFVEGAAEREGVAGSEHTPSVNDDPNKAYYSEESLVGYRWFDTKEIPVMYPFGHGLTYATFEYAALKTNKEQYARNEVISLSFKLENSGAMVADEVVQAYVHRINSTLDWPFKELKAFSRVTLEPGERKTIHLKIPVSTLFYWDESISDWEYDPCDLEILVGASAGDIQLKKNVLLK